MKVVVIDIIIYNTIYIQYIQFIQYICNICIVIDIIMCYIWCSSVMVIHTCGTKGAWAQGGRSGVCFVQVYEYLSTLFCYFWFSAPPSRVQSRLNFRSKRCPLTPYASSKPLFRSPLVLQRSRSRSMRSWSRSWSGSVYSQRAEGIHSMVKRGRVIAHNQHSAGPLQPTYSDPWFFASPGRSPKALFRSTMV